MVLDRRADSPEVEVVDAGLLDHAVRVPEIDEGVGRSGRRAAVGPVVRAVEGGLADVDRDRLAVDRGGDRAPRRHELELAEPVAGGDVPGGDARAVSGELGVGSVGVQDPHGRPVDDEDAVRACAEIGMADPRDPGRGHLEGRIGRLDDEVGVPGAVPLPEFHRRQDIHRPTCRAPRPAG